MTTTAGTQRHTDRRSVVFADDGAPAADAAWSWITSHQWAGWSLQTVTVHETLFPGGPPIGDAHDVRRRPPEQARFSTWNHVEADGDPRLVLLGHRGASLLVLGCHHHTHLAGLWAGSTTEWLLTGSPVPLLIARHGHRTRSVAICVDASAHSRRALDTFLCLPWSTGVEARLLSVADGTTDVERALDEAQAAFAGRTPPVAIRLAGAAKRVIPAYVRTHRVDLVVLGTRGLTGLERLVAGSTTSALVRDGTANLLVAHVTDVANVADDRR
jgi:nucleotide-binding universal stress UspA family protein